MPAERGGPPPQRELALGFADLSCVCGVDEAGRGPLAGPVFAAAVVLGEVRIEGLRDSKQMSAAQREAVAAEIRTRVAGWAVASASVAEIDTLNILQASLLAMRRAVARLPVPPTLARIDGNRAPRLRCAIELLVGGDASDPAISAASILAKTSRDAEMLRLHDRYPAYRFDLHKGYATAEHLAALRTHGPCAIHRRSFAPVRDAALSRGARAEAASAGLAVGAHLAAADGEPD